jgi:hypothetical protein
MKKYSEYQQKILLNYVLIILINVTSVYAGWDHAGRRHIPDTLTVNKNYGTINYQEIEKDINYCKEYRKAIEYRNIGISLCGLGLLSTGICVAKYFTGSSNCFLDECIIKSSFLIIGGIVGVSAGIIIINDNNYKIKEYNIKCKEMNNNISIGLAIKF